MSLIIAYLGIMSVLILALNARFFGKLFGIMDDPQNESHKSHTLPTPLLGALMIGVLAIFILANEYLFDTSTRMVGISVCTILAGMLGLVDDKVQLSWQVRLAAIGGVSTLLVMWVPELRLDNLMWSFGYTTELGLILGGIFTILCLMTLIISFNMMDGFNGGVISLGLILFIVMAIVATNPHRQAICLFLASALGLMLVFNMRGDFFLGDGGAYALGLLVGSVAILTYNVGASVTIYADTIFVWFALPTLDCLRVVISRKLMKANPFYAERDHLHHMLMNATGPKRTLLAFCLVIAAFSVLSIFSGQYTYMVLWAKVLTLGMLVIWSRKIMKNRISM